MREPVGRTAYQEVADDLRRRIGAGEFPVGSAIPSTAKLTAEYRVSTTVVRAAIAQLRADGVLVGRAGKGVFVRATPAAAAEQVVSVEDLARQVEELRAELSRVDSVQRDEVLAELAALRRQVGSIQVQVAALYREFGTSGAGEGAADVAPAGIRADRERPSEPSGSG